MPDELVSVAGGRAFILFRDMGDGSWQEVMAADLTLGSNPITIANPLPVVTTEPLPIIDVWTVALASDEGANDNDKTITVVADQLWHVLWVWVEYTSDANAGNRQIAIELQDAANDVIAQFRAGVVQAASLTRYYLFAPAMADLDAFRDTDYLMTPLPPTVLLPAGYQVRVYDNNGVAAGDDMVIQMQYAYRAA